MTQEEKQALAEKIGGECATKIQKAKEEIETSAKKVAEEAAKNNGGITEATFNEFKSASDSAIEEIKAIAEKQGASITELKTAMSGDGANSVKSIGELMKEDEAELRTIYGNRTGAKEYIIGLNKKGEITASRVSQKAAGPIATIDGTGGAGTVASISNTLVASQVNRLGADSPVFNQFRNTPWLFDLCNTVTTSPSERLAIWFDEQPFDGAAAITAEGATKPRVQYKYELNASSYKKVTQLVSFTEEFAMDFPRLQQDILGNGRRDVINAVNSQILPNIKAAATAFNLTGYKAPAPVTDWDVIAAMAAQVETSTFQPMANAAVLSTIKKYVMGTQKTTQGEWLNAPDILQRIGITSNPDMGADDVLVGDLTLYNILLRGGLIVRVGYNGTDFAENKFSVVTEQYYFDYISSIRKKGIVKGPDFATVKTAITAP